MTVWRDVHFRPSDARIGRYFAFYAINRDVSPFDQWQNTLQNLRVESRWFVFYLSHLFRSFTGLACSFASDDSEWLKLKKNKRPSYSDSGKQTPQRCKKKTVKPLGSDVALTKQSKIATCCWFKCGFFYVFVVFVFWSLCFLNVKHIGYEQTCQRCGMCSAQKSKLMTLK